MDDAIEVCFKTSNDLEVEAKEDPVHANEYTQLAKKLRNYAVSLLNQCRDGTEVKVLRPSVNF